MPSASTAADTKASADPADPIKQAVQLVDKKIRNLEKRKQKLESTRDKLVSGDDLNEDQKEAIAKINVVEGNLELVREMRGQFVQIQTEIEKAWVKQQKKERRDRQLQEMERFQSLLMVHDVLNNMGVDEIRDDFKSGNNGAVKLTEADLSQLDELHVLINPEREQGQNMADKLKSSSEHIVYLLDGKDKEVIGTTYKGLKTLTDSVYSCPYWTKSPETEVEEVAVPETLPVENGEPSIPETGTPDEFVDAQDSLTPDQPATTPIHDDVTPSHPIDEQHQMLNSQSAVAAGVVDDTFFATPRQRPFNEIVSSVQGSFTFIQDSEIDSNKQQTLPISQQEAAHIDPAILHAQPRQMPEPSAPQSYASFASDAHAQQNSVQQTQPGQTYSQHYNQIVQEQQQALEQNLRGGEFPENTPDPPEPIPMPNQNEGFGQDQDQSRPEKSFTMNAEATVFTSTAYQQQQQQLENDMHNEGKDGGEDDGFQSTGWAGFRGRSQGRGGGGGGRGGNRDRGSGQNGYRGNSSYNNQQQRQYNNNGQEQQQQRGAGGQNNNYDNNNPQQQQRGGRGSGGGGGQGANFNRGSGGSYQGYPPRDNYRPEGGYQGYQRNEYNNKRGGGGGQGGRDGASRGGARGGGFGARGGGNFNSRGGGASRGGNRQNYNQQQQNVQ